MKEHYSSHRPLHQVHNTVHSASKETGFSVRRIIINRQVQVLLNPNRVDSTTAHNRAHESMHHTYHICTAYRVLILAAYRRAHAKALHAKALQPHHIPHSVQCQCSAHTVHSLKYMQRMYTSALTHMHIHICQPHGHKNKKSISHMAPQTDTHT
jgi:hypothetical protein